MSWGDRAAEQHEKDQPSVSYDALTLARHSVMGEIQVIEDGNLRNGVGYLTGGLMILGTRPWTEVEKAGYRAKVIVNHGLADVVRWLEEPLLPKDPPKTSVMDFLRNGYEVEMPGFLGNRP